MAGTGSSKSVPAAALMKTETTDGLKALSCWANKGELRPLRKNSGRSETHSGKAKPAASEMAARRAKNHAITRRA
jgi:hypothetical protein